MRSTTLAAPLLLARPAGAARARRVAAAARRAARAGRGLLRRRARRAPRRVRPGRARRGGRHRRAARHPGAREHHGARRASTRRGWRARPARGRPSARRRCAAAGAARCGRRRPAPSRRAWATAAFADFVRRALFLDRDDPAAAWGELRARAGAADRAACSGARELRIEADGTDLHAPRRRAHVGQLRRAAEHAVSGEVFTGPLEDSRRGPHPLHDPLQPARRRGRGVELEFRDGPRRLRARRPRRGLPARHARHRRRRARASASSGSARTSGIDRPIGAILFDEKIGGTVHLALGRSYPETGGTNDSAVHWDMICDLRDGGRLTADGELVELPGT